MERDEEKKKKKKKTGDSSGPVVYMYVQGDA
jgi:hypothetical protein